MPIQTIVQIRGFYQDPTSSNKHSQCCQLNSKFFSGIKISIMEKFQLLIVRLNNWQFFELCLTQVCNFCVQKILPNSNNLAPKTIQSWQHCQILCLNELHNYLHTSAKDQSCRPTTVQFFRSAKNKSLPFDSLSAVLKRKTLPQLFSYPIKIYLLTSSFNHLNWFIITNAYDFKTLLLKDEYQR